MSNGLWYATPLVAPLWQHVVTYGKVWFVAFEGA